MVTFSDKYQPVFCLIHGKNTSMNIGALTITLYMHTKLHTCIKFYGMLCNDYETQLLHLMNDVEHSALIIH